MFSGYEILDKVDKLIAEKKDKIKMHRDDLATKLKERGFDYFKSCCSEGYHNKNIGVAITMLDSEYRFKYRNHCYDHVDIMNGYEILDKVDKLIIEKKKETEMHRDDLITKLKEKGFDYFKSCCSEGYYNELSGVAITMLDSKYKFIYTNNRYNYVDIMNGYEILEKVDTLLEENMEIEMNKAKIPLKSLLGIIDKHKRVWNREGLRALVVVAYSYIKGL